MTVDSLLSRAEPAPAAGAAAPEPTLAYAFSARVELLPVIEQGEIDGERKRFVPIAGGTVSGPRLNGTVLAGGGDWQSILPGGITRMEARYFLQADDGAVIGVLNRGIRVASEAVTDQIARGVPVPPDSYYFRSNPVFNPPPGAHGWLRERMFVARAVRMPDHVVLDFYTVE